MHGGSTTAPARSGKPSHNLDRQVRLPYSCDRRTNSGNIADTDCVRERDGQFLVIVDIPFPTGLLSFDQRKPYGVAETTELQPT